MLGAGELAISTGFAALLVRGAGEGLAGCAGAVVCGGCVAAGSAGAAGALSVVWAAGDVRASGWACDCPRHTMNSSPPTTTKATRMPIWTIFI
jgi:hypothetical protein